VREIKYKAYWQESKLMTSVDTIEFLSGGTRVSDGCMHTGWVGRECELIQFTGQKGLNEIEIYYGDIVECFMSGLSEVVWKAGCFGVLDEGYFVPFSEVHGYCKVIGNRYENPELLKED